MKKKIVTILILSLFILFTGCTKYIDKGIVNATVTDKKYSSEYYMPMVVSCGKTTTIIQQYYPETYEVKLQYKNFKTTSQDPQLYKKVKIGDKVTVKFLISEDGKKGMIKY